MRRRVIQGLLLTLWIAFAFWYTNTRGPLSDDEIEHYVARYGELNPDADLDRLRNFLGSDTGNQFMMVNLIDMADDPPAIGSANESAEALLGRYMEHMYPALFQRACHPVYVGDAVSPALDLTGISGGDQWTRAALMRYRSRRDLVEIAINPAFADKHQFKLAALDKTIAFPVESVIYLSDPRLLLGLILLALCAVLPRNRPS